MNAWDTDPQYLAGAWRRLFAFLARRNKPERKSRPVGSCTALG